MRKLLLLSLILFTGISNAQLSPGDVAFVGFNGDGADDFAIVALAEIPANTIINFRDDEWNGAAFVDGAEGAFAWNSGANAIAAGTIITFNRTSATVAPLPSSSLGTISGELINLNASDEVLYAYLGSTDVPTVFLTAFASGGFSVPNGILPAELTEGVSAINFITVDDDADIAVYAGSINDKPSSFLAYKTVINTPSNWISQDGANDQSIDVIAPDLPFSTTPFTIVIPTVNLSVSQLTGSEASGTTITVTASASQAVFGNQTITIQVSGAGITGTDYNLTNPTITIADGQTESNISFIILNDADAECLETATLTLTNFPSGIAAGNIITKDISITDDEIIAPSVNLTTSAVSGTENAATSITVTATSSAAVTGNQTVSVGVSGSGITLADYTLNSSTITILNGATVGTTAIAVTNDLELEGSEIFRVTLSNPSSCLILGATTFKDHLIFDNDFPTAPTGSQEIQLSLVSSFLNESANPANSAEISAYDPVSKRLFIANSLGRKLNIVDMSNPASMTAIASVDISAFGGVNSVAVKNGIVALAIEATDLVSNGSVRFYDTNGVFQNQVTVGSMPDMITFSPSGNLVLTANEGEPSDNYLTDPEGTVSIIDISGGVATASVTTANFNAFDGDLATLKAAGVRIYGANNPTVSKDFEPEYISFSSDGNTAYVTLQENNAIAVLDLGTKAFTAIRPLGLKDHNLITNGLDASDQGGVVNIANLPVKGMYQPDAIASFVFNNETYLVTANEGDSRVYPRTGTATFNEEARVSSLTLDPTAFPNGTLIKNNAVLGRLQLSNKTGDTDGDGDFDELHALGSRSFSIWKPSVGGMSQIFDSKDQFERITAANTTYGNMFNASHGNVTLKDRSDNKGPEPEGVAIGVLEGKTYAFIALERIGGVMIYNITNPNSPVFVQWINNRSTTTATGDLGSEGVFFVSAADSPTGVPLVVVSNEVSSTVSVYAVAIPRSVVLTTNAVTGTETAGTSITITATASGPVSGDQTVSVSLSGTGITAGDYSLPNPTITILNGQTVGTTALTITNDSELEGSEIVRIALVSPSANLTLGATTFKDHMIFDNDFAAAPMGNGEIQLSFVSSYLNGSANPTNSAEISAFDPDSKRLFIANSVARKLDIVDMSNPAAITAISSIDISSFGGINSVAVKNGIVALAIESTDLVSSGSVLFYNTDGVFQKQVTVGSMPDMITFSPNGNLVLTANEGEPSDDYTIDPEGTVSIIDISGGIANVSQSNVTAVNFNAFDGNLTALKAAGVRIYGANGATVSKDFEPEYISFSSDGMTAYVTLQENNAIAVLDINTKAFTAIRPLGLKDHNTLANGLDATDQGGVVNIANLPIKGMYQPDAIASFVYNGENYLVTANEGDSRVYPRTGSATFNEEARVSTLTLDPTAFPNGTLLKNNAVLGRLQLTNKTGDTDGDGDFDEIHALGARSFSIWKPTASGLDKIFDSGDQFERITAADATYGAIFNASNDIATPALKNRSDNKGPEPEGVAIGILDGKTYAFIALERIGGVMVYNITNPNSPIFVQWINNRSTTAAIGDLGSEGIFFVSATDSPTGIPLVVVSNEISSTVSVYSVSGLAIPSVPTNLVASNGTVAQKVSLSWADNSSTEAGFEIFRSTNETSVYEKILSVGAGETIGITDQTENTVFFYKIRAFNDFGYSAFTTPVSIMLMPAPLAADATEIGLTSFKANWSTATGATEYKLYISSDNFVNTIAGYNGKVVTATVETVTGLTPNTNYKYKVVGVSGAYQSLYSNTVEVTTIAETRILSIAGDLAFGNVIVGEEPPVLEMELTNTGNSPLTVTSITYPTDFTSSTVNLALEPNQSATISVIFDPTEVKAYNANITFSSNATSGNAIWPVTATAVAITGLEAAQKIISVNPNPSSGKFLIQVSEPVNFENMILQNANGARLEMGGFELISDNAGMLDLSDQATGVYLLRIPALQGVLTIKLIKTN